MYSSWEIHLDDQDRPSLELGGGTLQALMRCLDPQTNCEQVMYLQGTRNLDIPCNS